MGDVLDDHRFADAYDEMFVGPVEALDVNVEITRLA